MSMSDTVTMAELFAKSGYFKDAESVGKAIVKIQAGRELGIGPAASMTAVHIVQGKPTLAANAIAAKVKGSAKYDYDVIELSEDRCEIAFMQGDGTKMKEIGRSVFTMADAKKAGLTSNPTWKKYPRNMLFSRAMSNGARWYCPDAFSGITVYTPEELGADVDGETGEVIDVTPRVVEPTTKPAPEWDEATVEAGEDEPANGHTPASVKEAVARLLIAANDETGGYYNSPQHLYNAIKKDGNGSFDWPPPDDSGAWNRLYKQAVSYATKEAA